MKKIKVEDAVGRELCHDITAMRDGFKGAAFKRGHVITEEDIPKLLDIGKRTVYVWEPEAGEIHEEDCALRMAAMCPVEGAHYTGPSEGKVLLFADTRGMLRINTELLREINELGIGPAGYGGDTTALAVFVKSYPCHIASLPVAVTIQCHAARHEVIRWN